MQALEFNYLSKAQVLKTLNVSERTLENLVREQKFPPGVKLGRSVYWSPSVIQQWLDAQFANQLAFAEKPKRRMTR